MTIPDNSYILILNKNLINDLSHMSIMYANPNTLNMQQIQDSIRQIVWAINSGIVL